jgi:hypothetical protein
MLARRPAWAIFWLVPECTGVVVTDLSLRPRSATELIDAAFRMYRQYFAGFITLSAIVYLPAFILRVLIGRLAPQVDSMQPGPIFGLLGAGFVMVCWYAIMEGALAIATSDRYLGKEIEPTRSLRDAMSRAGALIGAKLWTWFVMFWMFVFFIFVVPIFYFFARYFAVPQAILFERLGVGRGLDRSRQLSKGEKWKILKSLGMVWLIVLALTIGVDLTFAPEPGQAPSLFSDVIGTMVSMIAFPLIPITSTLMYYDVRIRREGFDIELMSADLEGPAPVVGAAQG